MGDRRLRGWRGVRTWGTGLGHGPAAGETLVLEAGTGVDDDPSLRCGASGWRLRDACTDGHGGAICPLCGERVDARPDVVVGPAVRVIQEHGPVSGRALGADPQVGT